MLKPLRKILLTIFGIMPMMLPLDNARAADAKEGTNGYLTTASEMPWRKARLSLEAQTGSRNIGTLDAMIPFIGNDDFIIYADLMAKGTTDNSFEGNLGLGFRRVNDAETSIFGMYAFYDILKSEQNNQFTQVTVGAEHLGLVWDFRANAYLPVGKTKHVFSIYDQASTQIIGNNIIQHYQLSEEMAQMGGDIEIGRTLGTNKLRAYVAAYTFGDNLTGPRARLEYQINSHVTLNTAVQHDQTRKTQYFVGARFTIGGARAANSDSIYSRLTDPVVRDVDVVTKSKFTDTSRTATDKFWMVDQTKTQSGGNGTVDNPFANLNDAIAAAPEGAIIYVKGADGKIYDAGQGTTLKSGHTIVGSVNDLYYDFEKNTAHSTKTSSNILVMQGNGVRPTISGTLIANSHVGIHNLNLMANDLVRDQAGIIADNVQDVMINDVSISGFNAENGQAISVVNNSNVSFTNLSTSDNYIGVNIENSQVNITNTLNVDHSQFAGLQVINSTVNVDAANITNSGEHGVLAFSGTLNVKNNLNIAGANHGINAQAGAIINVNSATLNNSNLHLDAAQLNIANDFIVDANTVHLENGSKVNANSANVNAKKMTVDNSQWLGIGNSITLNGSNEYGLRVLNNSQVSFESVITNQDIIVNNATATIANVETYANIDLAAANFIVKNALQVNADAQHTITIDEKSTLQATNATLTLGNIILKGKLIAEDGTVNAQNLSVNGGQLLGTNGQLVVNGITADSFTLSNGGSIDVASTSVNNSNIVVDGANSYLNTHILKVTQIPTDAKIKNSAVYKLEIREGGKVTAKQESNIVTNKVILDNGIFDVKKGSITVSGSDVDGVVLANDSQINVNNLTVNNHQGHGLVIDGATLNAQTITANNNQGNGINLMTGNIRVNKMTATQNVQQGIMIKEGMMDAKQLVSSNNSLSGLMQTAGTLHVNDIILDNNLENGFTKLGGKTNVDKFAATNNGSYGLQVNYVYDNNNNLIIKNSTINNNKKAGVLLNQGQLLLENTKVNDNNKNSNQIVVQGETGGRELIITGQKIREVYTNSISAGTVTATTDKDKAAILVASDATVMIDHADISNSQGGYGLLIDAGKVTLSQINSNNNDRAIVLTQGDLVIDHAIIANNKEMGIVVKDLSRDLPVSRDQRQLTLSNVNLGTTNKTESTIAGIGYGLVIVNDSNVNVKDSLIHDNGVGGIYLSSGAVDLNNLTITNNTGAGIEVAGENEFTVNIHNSLVNNAIEEGEASKQQIGLKLNAKNATVIADNIKVANNTNGIEYSASTDLQWLNSEIYGSENGINISADSMRISALNNIHDNVNGIKLSAAVKNISFVDMVITNNENGVLVEGNGQVLIKGVNNAIFDNTETGLIIKNIEPITVKMENLFFANHKTGIQINGNNVTTELKDVTITNASDGVGVKFNQASDSSLTSISGNQISGGKYGVEISGGAGIISLNNLVLDQGMDTHIHAQVLNPIKLNFNNVSLTGNAKNGIRIDVAAKANFDLKMTGGTINNASERGVYITEQTAKYSEGSKIWWNGTNFSNNLVAVESHSFTTLYLQNLMTDGANRPGGVGVISTGANSNEVIAGGSVFIDNVTIKQVSTAIISYGELKVSRLTTDANSMLKLAGTFMTGKDNQYLFWYDGKLRLIKSNVGGAEVQGQVTHTLNNEIVVPNNPLG